MAIRLLGRAKSNGNIFSTHSSSPMKLLLIDRSSPLVCVVIKALGETIVLSSINRKLKNEETLKLTETLSTSYICL